jgi:hypothetical protein
MAFERLHALEHALSVGGQLTPDLGDIQNPFALALFGSPTSNGLAFFRLPAVFLDNVHDAPGRGYGTSIKVIGLVRGDNRCSGTHDKRG